MAKKRRCSTAGRLLKKSNSSYAGEVLAECRWKKPGAKKKQSKLMKARSKGKSLLSRMKK
jgi:hypothetical protein